jgi:hypothetical protein
MEIRKSAFSVAVFLACASNALCQTTNPPPAVAPDAHIKHAGVQVIGNWQVDPAETQELDQMFATATAAADSITPSVDAGAQRHAVNNSLRAELENFLIEHPNSAYGPGVHIWLGRQAMLVSGYSLGINHLEKAFDVVSKSPDPTALILAMDAGGTLDRISNKDEKKCEQSASIIR